MHKEMGAAGTERLRHSTTESTQLPTPSPFRPPVGNTSQHPQSVRQLPPPASGVYSTMGDFMKSWEHVYGAEQLPGVRTQSGTKEENRMEGNLPMRSWVRTGRVLSAAGKPVEYQVMG